MKRVWGHVLAGLSLTAAGVAIFTACTHDDSSFFVQNVLAQQLVTPGQIGCAYTNSPTQPVVSSGVLDVALRGQYDAEFLVGNQMVAQGNPDQLRTETSTINIQGAVVRITDASGNQLKSYQRLTSGTVYPSTGGTPGYTPVSITILDHDTVMGQAGSLQPGATVRLVTYTRFFGKTLGGQSIESNEFEFPIDVCRDCLITFSQADINACFQNINCLGSSTSGSSSSTALGTPCILGQDVPLDCAVCKELSADCNPNPGAVNCQICPLMCTGGGDAGTPVDAGGGG